MADGVANKGIDDAEASVAANMWEPQYTAFA